MPSCIRVKAKFYGNWRDITGEKELEFEVPDKSTLLDLIKIISARYGEEFKNELIDDNNSLLQPFSVSLNNELINPIEGTKSTLNDGDEIMFLFPVMGG